MRYRHIGMVVWALLVVASLPVPVAAAPISLTEYLAQLRAHHPFFEQQRTHVGIARQQQGRLLGDKEWTMDMATFYDHDQSSAPGLFMAEEDDRVTLSMALKRPLWDTGGNLAFSYDYYRSDQRYAPPVGGVGEYGNSISFTYMQPLLKNRGGVLSRLDYELQDYDVARSELDSQEAQEQFIEQQAALFLDWAHVTEQRRIAETQLRLAEEEQVRTEKKRRTRLVAEIEVLRARDAVINARQNLAAIESQWQALQVELATHSGIPALTAMTPQLDLYRLNKLPAMEAAVTDLQQRSRRLRIYDLQLAQLEHLKQGLDHELKPQLDLVIGGGLGSEAERLSDSAELDQPHYRVGLNLRYPLGRRKAKADLSKARSQRQQLLAARSSLGLDLEAQLRKTLTQLTILEEVMTLNREQIRVARLRTAEELNRYEQSRSELSFVIQSRNNEQGALLTYAANAASYQRLWLRYRSLADRLLPAVVDDTL